MRTYDFSPLLRHSIGFDRMQHLLNAAAQHENTNSYPPYNIQQLDDDHYQITMAIAGFSETDLEVTVEENTLVVRGEVKDGTENLQYLHRGIAGRAFERRFQLADHIKVTGGDLTNGLLNIELERDIPEEKKPRRIQIGSQSVTDKKAA